MSRQRQASSGDDWRRAEGIVRTTHVRSEVATRSPGPRSKARVRSIRALKVASAALAARPPRRPLDLGQHLALAPSPGVSGSGRCGL